MPKTASRPSWAAGRRRLLTLALGLAAWRGSGAAEPQADLVDYDLQAGPLAATLLAIGRLSGAMVSFKPRIVGPHEAPAVRGRFTLKQALALALQPSGLSARITPSGVVTIVEGPGRTP